MRCLTAILALWAVPATAQMEHLSTYVWETGISYFGGLSGIEIAPDGLSYIAISDSGFIATGQIEREDGLITALSLDPTYLVPDPSLWPDTGDPSRDSEGIAVDAEGRVFVSYEGITEVRQEMGRDVQPLRLSSHPDFADFQKNGGFEALAIDADGVIYAIPERSGRAMRPFPIYRHRDGVWDIAGYLSRPDLFLPVGADFGPDGRLYVLEREFNGWAFTSRIRSFAPDGSEERLVWQSAAGEFDNLEGLSIWQDAGGVRVTMISDDNYRWLQETQVVEFRLTP